MDSYPSIRIGTRGSTLARWQAEHIKKKIQLVHPKCRVSIVIIQTKGDMSSRDISDLGGKGAFVKDIEQALLDNHIDVAVHSFKDITSRPHSDLICSGFILEERPTDAFVLFNHRTPESDMLQLATSSLRRQTLCRQLYPNITCIPMRGNIDVRIKKAREQQLDGLILSAAGLQRLNLEHLISFEPSPTLFVPAPGQGFLALQNRVSSKKITALMRRIIDPKIHAMGEAYYEFLTGVQFNCNIPLGAYIHQGAWHVVVWQGQRMTHSVNDTAGLVQRVLASG
jgi:hydroxymethylbilane synthase